MNNPHKLKFMLLNLPEVKLKLPSDKRKSKMPKSPPELLLKPYLKPKENYQSPLLPEPPQRRLLLPQRLNLLP